MSAVPECVAAGYVDMDSGMLLGVKTTDSHPQEVPDLVAAATADLFQGTNVTSIEKLFRQTRGVSEDGVHYFQQMIVYSENLVHFFVRGAKHTNQAAVFVCRGGVNVGMGLNKSRALLVEIEASV